MASLAYDAVSLVALLSPGRPYHRFTIGALMDPNGFSGVNGIFRFKADGTSERGLAARWPADGLRKVWERELRALAEGRPLKQWTRPETLTATSGV